jgi:two-component system sensor histidine kinase VicK
MGLLGRLGGKNLGASGQLANKLQGEQLKSDIIINAIDEGIMLIDYQQVIGLLNPAGEAVIGWQKKEAEGLNWHSVLKFVDKKGEASSEPGPIEQAFSDGKTVRGVDLHLKLKDGRIIDIAMTASPLLREGDTVNAVIVIFRDISEERKEEAQRAEFISTASHEMRTPVAAIEGYLALALNDKVGTVDSRARGYLEKAHDSAEHLGKLFQDLLTSAKAEDGRLTSHPVVIEVGEFLEQLSNDLRLVAEKKGMLVEFTLGGNQTIDASKGAASSKVIRPLYYALADQDRLREVITNLFDNAVKYSEKGKITIGLTGNDEVVQFFVRDTGSGIPANDIPHLFQKFYRVDNSATRTIGGTGLGLFISRKIIELYGGRIWVESVEKQGSTFYINLPRLSTQKAEKLRGQEGAKTELAPITSLADSVVQ